MTHDILSRREQDFFRKNFPEVPLQAIGKQIGIGAENVVREFCDEKEQMIVGRVIKYSRGEIRRDLVSVFAKYLLIQSPDSLKKSRDLCFRYYSKADGASRDYVVPTDIFADKKANTHYYILQERLTMETLTAPMHAESPALRDQLKELLEINRRMMTDSKIWFDFMGWDPKRLCAGEAYMANLGVTRHKDEGDRINLFDFSLYPTSGLSLKGIHGSVTLAIQTLNLRRFGVRM